jgi:Glycine zipper
MRNLGLLGTCILAMIAFLSTAVAQEMVIYPANNQSNEQLEKDKYECYGWAKQQSGFDPMAPPTTKTAPPKKQAKKGGVGRGALRGTAGGAAVGAIAGDTKKGMKIGAASGALIGGARRRDQKRQEQQSRQQWEQQEAQNYQAGRNNYNRNFAACMEGRKYTVK